MEKHLHLLVPQLSSAPHTPQRRTSSVLTKTSEGGCSRSGSESGVSVQTEGGVPLHQTIAPASLRRVQTRPNPRSSSQQIAQSTQRYTISTSYPQGSVNDSAGNQVLTRLQIPTDDADIGTYPEHEQTTLSEHHAAKVFGDDPYPETPTRTSPREYSATNPFALKIPRMVMCDDCRRIGEDRSLCNICNELYCDECWSKERKHRNGVRTQDGVPHEPLNHLVARKIQACLEAPNDSDQHLRHAEDEHTAWFGVTTDYGEDLLFEDFGRYAALLAESSVNAPQTRYPGLVAFVGQTGAGKSTLIKFLIEFGTDLQCSESPVVGSINSSVPTSGDVHLYKDPKTASTPYPILFADCEGLHGGERLPLGAKAKFKAQNKGDTRTSAFQKKIRKLHNSHKREIQWANSTNTRSREFAVTNLYPRLLFTFADAIVFVSKNPRELESTIATLLEWADTALETSSNQPVLPHLIIALNASEHNLDPEQWDVDNATRIHTAIPLRALHKNPRITKFIKYWQDRQRPINSTMDLLTSYFTTVRVIRIPTGARPKLVHEQMEKLYNEIHSICSKSRHQKRSQRMSLTADELQPYLQCAFDHFCKTLHEPFDFVKASFQNSSIPTNFGGGILRMAIDLMQIWKDKIDAEHIFSELSIVVASCIMLDSVRRGRLGGAETLFPHYYMSFCDEALEDFCTKHWPCEFTGRQGRCVNVQNGHNYKGHQSKNGKVFAFGSYVSSFSTQSFGNKWRSMIFYKLKALLKEHNDKINDFNQDEVVRIAYKIHQDKVMTPFFEHSGTAVNFNNHSICYLCLMSPPDHSLPCGHVICTRCLQVTSTAYKCALNVSECPLKHPGGANFDMYIKTVPEDAGIRVLSLDGGGIKGIVELEILRLLEKEFCGYLRLQDFFDLIVGTSAGGIIALGLGVENWTVQECLSKFEKVCAGAFTPRRGESIPLLGKVVAAHYNSRYKTKPLESILTNTFSNEYLFGGPRLDTHHNHSTKVAVVATTPAGVRPVVISNYNRVGNPEINVDYHFQRPEKVDSELKIWEAARATSAAPTMFKSFIHQASQREYIDGALKHNNPVAIAEAERKMIWPGQADHYPDILVSVGSGCSELVDNTSPRGPGPVKRGTLNTISNLMELAFNTLRSSINAERSWDAWVSAVDPKRDEYRFHRLNAYLPSALPKLDDVEAMFNLKHDVRTAMSRDSKLRHIAQQLIATSFFFERTSGWTKREDGSKECTGNIMCRFMPKSKEICSFGRLLQRFVVGNHSPFFVIFETNRETEAQQELLTANMLDDLIRDGRFKLTINLKVVSEVSDSIISLCLEDVGDTASALSAAVSQGHLLGYPISGFPCRLNRDEVLREENLPSLSGNNRSPRRASNVRVRTIQDMWTPQMMDEEVKQDEDPIGRFSRSDYCIGGAAPKCFGDPSRQKIKEMDVPDTRISVAGQRSELSAAQRGHSRDESCPVIHEVPSEPTSVYYEMEGTTRWPSEDKTRYA